MKTIFEFEDKGRRVKPQREAVARMDCTVEFTKNEMLFLKDQLSLFTPGPEHGKGPYPELLLKIGAAIVEFHDDPTKSCLNLVVAQEEMWMIWEVAKSFATIGSETVGYNLTIKMAQGLQQVYAGAEVDAAIATFGETPCSEPGKAAYRDKLQKLRGGYEYGRDNKNTGSSHHSPGGGANHRA